MTSNNFAALMALSEARTQESTRAVDSIQAERRRKEEARRRQQEEDDRKEREQQAKMLKHQLEEQKREKEKQIKRKQEHEAMLKEMERREEEQRQALLYGPKKARDGASRHPASSTAGKRTSDDDSEADGGPALTREEKRERRLQQQFSQNTTRRAGSSAGTSRVARRLPGGALNVTTPRSQAAGGSVDKNRSVRARLAAMPNTLTKLNTVKRDTRTIDEILRDRAKAREDKTLQGEEAREFHDWFGTKPRAASTAKASSPPSPVASGASTPSKFLQRQDMISSATTKPTSPRPTDSRTPSLISSRSTPRTATKSSSHGARSNRPSLLNQATSSPAGALQRKRARSHPSTYDGSESDSEYERRPHKRAADASSNVIQDEIWKIFGRDRSKYVSRNVLSDDEDMEADMRALEREELTSARIALKEDLEAEEEERRHDEEKEKRRRRKERECSG
ncbi:hypothetical protein F5148DRAFT_972680 [Russula earlei]|uniref:Uncharacterized protein n=1 Tax=Russula earlei TaxID=71964 RepID=A0ACC0UMV4_9AGAM|nr:hypothetical protein F5148DRAFT_972680 [Russula earlei]